MHADNPLGFLTAVRSALSRALLLFALAVTLVNSAFSQGNTGTLLGTVTDSTGAVVPATKITLKNVNTGVVSNTTTDNLGNYQFEFLPPGYYTVEAAASGFKMFAHSAVPLDAARQLRVDVTLEPGTVNESVTVNAEAPLLETETGTLS